MPQSANAEAQELIAAEQAKGLSREAAAARVFKRNPALREQMVAEANEGCDIRR